MRILFRLERIGDDAASFVRHSTVEGRRKLQLTLKAAQMGGFLPEPCVHTVCNTGAIGSPIRYRKDYSTANGSGSRGVFAEYELTVGDCYFVQERRSWRQMETYYVRADMHGVTRITDQEAKAWARDRSAPTF